MERLDVYINFVILVYLLVILTNCINGNIVHKKFEYKYSFKPPYLAQKDGSVPFWEYGGNAIASSENVRIAPSLRSQKGAIWTKSPINFDWWEVDIVFRVTGRGRIGADGLAFWYTQSKGAYDGDVFGSSDKWVGLGIFFDSFDNDNKHNNPYIMGMVNDGSKLFDHQNDGGNQIMGGCLRDFRNKPFPTRARVEYYNNVLTVFFHNGVSNNEGDYELCFRSENVVLPKGGYFGVSAATGGLADDHDVLHFLTSSLWPPGQHPASGSLTPSEEQQKLTQEYQEYQRKLEQQKEDYRKEHPDAKHGKDPELEDWYESDNQRELRQIFQGQSQMFDALRELNRKIDEIVGRQERTLSLISMVQQGVVPSGQVQPGAQVPSGQMPPPAQGFGDTIRKYEFDALHNNVVQVMNSISQITSSLGDLHRRTETVINNQAKQPTAQVQSVGYDMQSLVSEMRDGLNSVKQNVAQVSQKMGSSSSNCPNVSCVSVTSVLIISVVQLVILLGYSIYRDSKESQAKKFY
ncbi:hypothetical protein RN001_000915 [Aquatica leii]|uniref:L-type lectin-like domain-containing protein n=1 Tax=Aquatica leii TaxID=1421715 RepID=A0AAN7Q3H3_9COLE|nr:hypothetical protein RN001_000915 [Aquatica leii]